MSPLDQIAPVLDDQSELTMTVLMTPTWQISQGMYMVEQF